MEFKYLILLLIVLIAFICMINPAAAEGEAVCCSICPPMHWASTVSKQWFLLVGHLYSRPSTNHPYKHEIYLEDTDTCKPTFIDSLLSPYSLLNHISTLSISLTPVNNKTKRHCLLQTTNINLFNSSNDDNQVIQSPDSSSSLSSTSSSSSSSSTLSTFNFKTFHKLKLLVVSSQVLNHQLFLPLLLSLDRVQSTQPKRCLNKILIYIDEPILNTSPLFKLLQDTVAPHLTKISLIAESQRINDALEFTNYIDFVVESVGPKLRKLFIDVPIDLVTLLLGQAEKIKNVTSLHIATKFLKESLFPWQLINNFHQLQHLTTDFPQESKEFMDFLIASKTITTLGTAIQSTSYNITNLCHQTSLQNMTISIKPNFTGICPIYSIPPTVESLTILLDTMYEERIFESLTSGIYAMLNRCNVKYLNICKIATSFRIDGLGFLMKHNTSIKHLVISNVIERSPDGLELLFKGLKFNKTLETMSIYCDIKDWNLLFDCLIAHQSLTRISVNRKGLGQKFQFPFELSLKYTTTFTDSALVEFDKIE
ncbi:hypothetical protein DFA_09591 [Cavenderia fasciculata]|uniref:Uncharacterized protein n=1 Tax=Cavenderia fasciculata TaxID=261658 RepID=F4Q820_CACFS|nr:uncharacterized protein DFA_09591 [Cavenderia fasciculata]EGG15920.1 hypothetical protein DFA_09591 [Cavenderia fasciculata]|eukprot:XP_004352245.1 hypothetical protein DFA_09591 [Cavenderia fasciculata]